MALDVVGAAVICVDVVGRPAPKGSRNTARTRHGKLYTYPASRFEKPWVDAVTEATRVVMRHRVTLEPPYAVELMLRIAPPMRKAAASPWPTQHDIDKLARAVVDGLVKGKAIVDDRHILSLSAEKAFVEADEEPGVTAQIFGT